MRKLIISSAFVVLAASSAAAHDWSGPYIGAGIGLAAPEYRGDITAGGFTLPLSVRAQGASGNLFAGYNLTSGPWVYGAEIAGSYTRAETRFLTAKVGIDWEGSAAFRLGYAHEPIMPYGLIGIAATRAYAKASGQTEHETRYGLVIGAGLEHAISDRVRIRAEYRYSHGLSRKQNVFPGVTYRDRLDAHRVMFGASFALGR